MFSKLNSDKLIWLVVFILVLASFVLGILSLSTGFTVRSFNVLDQKSPKVDLYNQSFAVYFNRPILAGQNLDKLVQIEPVQKLYFSIIGDELLIQTSQILEANTDYTLTINKELLDIFNKPLTSDYKANFATRPLDLYYVKTNTGSTELVRQQFDSGDEEIIYKDSNIVRYQVGQNMLAAINQISFDVQTLNLIDLNTKKAQLPLPNNYSVYDFQFVPNQPFAYFTARIAEESAQYGVIYSTRKLYLLNLKTLKFELVAMPSAIEDIEELVISPDGQALLYKDTAESIFYLMDVTDSVNPVSIGKYVSTSGFNFSSQKLLFTAADFMNGTGSPFTVSVDADRKSQILQSDALGNIDPVWANSSDLIILSKQYADLVNTKGLYKLELIDKSQIINSFIKQGESLELAQISPDDRYIVVENYTITQLQDLDNLRPIGYQAKPGKGKLLVIDAKNWQVIKEIEAINALWY